MKMAPTTFSPDTYGLAYDLYAGLMFHFKIAEVDQIPQLWDNLSPSDKLGWFYNGDDYNTIMDQYSGTFILDEAHQEEDEVYAEAIYSDMMSCHHTDEEVKELWRNLSPQDKKLLLLMACGLEQ